MIVTELIWNLDTEFLFVSSCCARDFILLKYVTVLLVKVMI